MRQAQGPGIPFGPPQGKQPGDGPTQNGAAQKRSAWTRADLEERHTGLQQWALALQATAARHAALQSRLQQRVQQVRCFS